MSGLVGGLDAMPSPARVREIARARQLARFGRILDPELLDRQLDPARAQAFGTPTAPAHVRAEHLDPFKTCVTHARRFNNWLELHLAGAPRTKKNHGGNFGKKNPAYRKWLDDVKPSLRLLQATLALPLPAIAYNCAAVYYVDKRGELADYNGLNQGLHDALEHGGVLVDDWWIRTCDGTRIVFGDPLPRVELVLAPLPEAPATT